MKRILIITLSFMIAASCGNRLPIPTDSSVNKTQLSRQMKSNKADWDKVINFLKSTDFSTLEDGRILLNDDGSLFVNVQSYTTRDSGPFEAHRRYIDIQYVFEGQEYIYKSPLSTAEDCVQEYSDENDCVLYGGGADVVPVLADRNQIVVLFPDDMHMPCMKVNENAPVRKLCFKVPFVAE